MGYFSVFIMATTPEKMARRSLRSSYITTIISIFLVLFMLGFVGMLLLKANDLARHVKENLGFTVWIKESARQADIDKLTKTLTASDYVKTATHVSADEALERFRDELGTDFDVLDDNPLYESIEVRMVADYAHPDSISWITADIGRNPAVMEVSYQPDLLEKVNNNLGLISMFVLGFCAVLLFIAIVLINNSIRLNIYSRRFLIRTMQLVGASGGFIRRPFVWRGIRHGIYAAILAIACIAGLIYGFNQYWPWLFQLQDRNLIATLFGLVMGVGILISWISTFFAVRKYLRMRPDKLY